MPTYSWPIGIGPSTGSAPRYGHRSDPQMHDADKLMTASVGLWMVGSGRSSTRTSPGAYIIVARIYRSPPQGCRAVSPRTHHPGNPFRAFPGTACPYV